MGTLRLRARNILLLPLPMTAEFEMKNSCKSAEEANVEHLLYLFCSFLIVIRRSRIKLNKVKK